MKYVALFIIELFNPSLNIQLFLFYVIKSIIAFSNKQPSTLRFLFFSRKDKNNLILFSDLKI